MRDIEVETDYANKGNEKIEKNEYTVVTMTQSTAHVEDRAGKERSEGDLRMTECAAT